MLAIPIHTMSSGLAGRKLSICISSATRKFNANPTTSIKRGEVLWAGEWTDEEIEAGRRREGTVTLPDDERNNSPAHLCSRRANGLMPCRHRRSPETAVRFSRNEVALDVEGVVGGSMDGEKSLG